jgi:hypothetical protein
MSPVPPLLHVGYHKTGTTWLQREVFPHPESSFCLPWIRDQVLDALILPKDLYYDAEAARRFFAPGLAQAEEAGRTPVLSFERLTGNPHVGGYDSRILADRLAGLFPKGRVLLVVREQRSMILSLYKQYVREGGALSLRRYLYPPREGRARVPGFDFRFFEYDRLVSHYRKRFGEDSVLALPYEMLRADARLFVRRVAEFAGAAPPPSLPSGRRNVAHPACTLWLKRALNLLFVRSTLNPIAPFDLSRWNWHVNQLVIEAARVVPRALRGRSERRLAAIAEEEVGDRYRESNRRLSELVAADLAGYGYTQ